MNKIIGVLEKYFVPFAGRIGAQRHLVAIRDGFVTIMPLMILGSFATLINALPIDAYQSFMKSVFGENWTMFGGVLWQGTFAIVSLLVAFTIAYSLAKSYDKDGLSSGVVSIAALLSIMATTKDGGFPLSWASATGLFVAIFVALVSTEIFTRLLGNSKLNIKMPDGVPPAVSKSFAALLPAMITLTIFGLIKVITVKLGIPDLHQALYDLLQAPIAKLANTLWSAIVIAIVNHFLWFFGLHGSNILEPLMQAVYLPAINENIAALKAGAEIPNIVTKSFFDGFVYLGGSGATIGLLIAILISGRKHKQYKDLSKLSVAPGLFNINEPVVFGLPIVLNPILFIPFILTPLVLTILSYLAIATGIVPKTVVLLPWTTPPIIGGVVATASWKGGVLAAINLVISIIIYIPFIKMAERAFLKKENEQLHADPIQRAK
ncbi:PTS cellobiose transporter subunit IIC [Heyndrickxia sporothermodurans]|uniref:PTS cellobiose transporter subunit IIC n=1 Tax=Heyndrickxia sporothermodurans TaxID=46224 RepID=UPI002DB92B04|nr:PTS cellobiose transporter subunit IIC [Heyndrickxia sporothermodurans]MEB6550114.1 PTS cellobiose transporter subunit IIC [Heyndrickxia sporothermodurans]